MRTELKVLDGEVISCTALVGTFSARQPHPGKRATGVVPTVCLLEVRSRGRAVTDHVWADLCPALKMAGLSEGDRIRFTARVAPYVGCMERNGRKRHHSRHTRGRIDYQLVDISQVRVIERME